MGAGARRDPLRDLWLAIVCGSLPAGSRGRAHQQEARRMTRKWKVLPAVGMLASALVLASVVFAATAVKGGSYTGSLVPSRDGVLVSFKVSASGKQVTSLSTSNTPLYCSGGGKP